MSTDTNIIKVNIDELIPSKYQPRKVFEEESIKELALSIKTYGILNPLLVRKISSGYEIIAGERRYRAAKMLGLTEVPVIVKDIDETGAKELALIENIQRNNLNPIEEAKTYKEILESSNITQEELSQKLGKSQSAISNKMRLLNLNEQVQEALLNSKISEKHGRTLLKLNNEEQNTILEEIINKKLSVKETEELINHKHSKKNIQNVLNSLNIDNKNSDTFNDIEREVTEKGEDNMNNNTGMGSFFPQMDNPNQNTNLNNGTITFNNMPINNDIPQNDTIMFNNTATTVPLNTLNQEPIISTIPTQPLEVNPSIEPAPMVNSPIDNNSGIVNPMPTIEPTINSIPESTVSEPISMMPDPPLFTTLTTESSLSKPEDSYTVPVNNSISAPVPEKTSMDKIKELLSTIDDSKITYKEYSNVTENCIIISIQK